MRSVMWLWTARCVVGASGHIYARHNMTCDFQERKSVSRPSIAVSLYPAGHISSLLVLLDTSSSSMSTFQNTEYVDARGATFNNVGRDQINADQVIINPNSVGAMQNHSCTIICSFSVIPDSRSQGTAKPSTRCRV